METRDFIFSIVIVTLLLVLFLSFTISLIVLFQKRRNQHKIALLKLENEFTKALQSSQIEIQENTLRDISQELHDNISQQLGLVKLQLSQMEIMGGVNRIRETKDVVSRTLEDLRHLSHSLHPDRIANFSFKENLLFELEKIKKLGSHTIYENLEPDAEILGKDKKVILFRIMQELINNMLRHADATVCTLSVWYTSTHIHLQLEDNGRGIATENKPGIGLLSIHNRLALLKGALNMENKSDKGLTISVQVPLK